MSNGEIKDIMKIVKSLEDSVLLMKGVIETIQNNSKEKKETFLAMLLVTLGASLLRNMLGRKGIKAAGDKTIRTGYGS